MMNREIKFRVWYGDEMVPLGMAIKDEIVSYDFQDYYIQSEYDDMPLMQYTGLKDKNGKEIYEGDYLSNGIDGHKWEIQWAIPEDYCGWVAVNENGTRELFLNKHFINSQVIGNIYES
jgi:uncharacterized phage protein (TIGR01671 family)